MKITPSNIDLTSESIKDLFIRVSTYIDKEKSNLSWTVYNKWINPHDTLTISLMNKKNKKEFDNLIKELLWK